MQVRGRREAIGEAVQVLQPEAQGSGLGVHSAEEELVRDRGVPAAEGTPACHPTAAARELVNQRTCRDFTDKNERGKQHTEREAQEDDMRNL